MCHQACVRRAITDRQCRAIRLSLGTQALCGVYLAADLVPRQAERGNGMVGHAGKRAMAGAGSIRLIWRLRHNTDSPPQYRHDTMPRRRWLAALALIILVFAGYRMVDGSSTFHACLHDHKHDAAYASLYNTGPITSWVTRLRLQTACLAQEAARRINGLGF